eukprot:TRINITY_DN3127_c0_g1_i2.p1 TRINITY_DN3127_c0_g1~~TRINITY_DN3127_c0_g1_i2.p1  ORF type:complete len:332 (+),score=45.60 TRINITY_DN3127_c0_g1_i2:1012-2007(+)
MYFDNVHGLTYRDITSPGFPRTLNDASVNYNDTLLVAESSGFLVHQSPTTVSILSITDLTRTNLSIPEGYISSIQTVNDLKGHLLLSLSHLGSKFIYAYSFDDLSNPISITNDTVSLDDAVNLNVDERRSIFLFRKPIEGLYRLHYGDCEGQGLYGEYCSIPCECIESNTQNCLDGVAGNGSCVCLSNYTGDICEDCNSGYFGSEISPPTCYMCSCVNGDCDDGNVGYGTCNCTGNWDGPSCDVCLEGWKGPDCATEVASVSQIDITGSSSSQSSSSTSTSTQASTSSSTENQVSNSTTESTSTQQMTSLSDQSTTPILLPAIISLIFSIL